MLCAKFDWNLPSGSGEGDENMKNLQTNERTDGQTDKGCKAIRKISRHISMTYLRTPWEPEETSENSSVGNVFGRLNTEDGRNSLVTSE